MYHILLFDILLLIVGAGLSHEKHEFSLIDLTDWISEASIRKTKVMDKR